jgi:hypothetical protein
MSNYRQVTDDWENIFFLIEADDHKCNSDVILTLLYIFGYASFVYSRMLNKQTILLFLSYAVILSISGHIDLYLDKETHTESIEHNIFLAYIRRILFFRVI